MLWKNLAERMAMPVTVAYPTRHGLPRHKLDQRQDQGNEHDAGNRRTDREVPQAKPLHRLIMVAGATHGGPGVKNRFDRIQNLDEFGSLIAHREKLTINET